MDMFTASSVNSGNSFRQSEKKKDLRESFAEIKRRRENGDRASELASGMGKVPKLTSLELANEVVKLTDHSPPYPDILYVCKAPA
ncbi:hypothetical protein C0993_012705 [Termitomyces sp. T159_Od127]|nr:hypothetical protein C0993_012705 [Termitomyces sp. T159_Od127]